MRIRCPEKLVRGKYNIISTNGDYAAILWRDDQYFVITARQPERPEPITEMGVISIEIKGSHVHPEPIPLDDLSEWQERAREVNIPLTSVED